MYMYMILCSISMKRYTYEWRNEKQFDKRTDDSSDESEVVFVFFISVFYFTSTTDWAVILLRFTTQSYATL